jgi:hypothetical protein
MGRLPTPWELANAAIWAPPSHPHPVVNTLHHCVQGRPICVATRLHRPCCDFAGEGWSFPSLVPVLWVRSRKGEPQSCLPLLPTWKETSRRKQMALVSTMVPPALPGGCILVPGACKCPDTSKRSLRVWVWGIRMSSSLKLSEKWPPPSSGDERKSCAFKKLTCHSPLKTLAS